MRVGLVLEDLEILGGHPLQHLLAFSLILEGDQSGTTQAPVFAAAQNGARMERGEAEKVKHDLNGGGLVQIPGRLQCKAPAVQLMAVQKLHRAILNFNPLDQIALEEAETRKI